MKILYYLAYTFWFMLSLLPLRVLYVLSDVLYFLICHVVKYRHKVIWKNISTSFPELSEAEWRAMERGFYRWFTDTLAETIKMMTMSRRQMMRRMRFTGCEEINQCVERGQSVAVYLGHYGQWEWVTSLPLWVTPKAQCTQIYHVLENPHFDKLFLDVRQRWHSVCIPMAETLRRIVDYRRQGTPIIMGYIADQVPFWNNIHHWLPFLHHDTPVLTGTERLVKKVEQAVFYADVRRVKRGYYVCEMQKITTEPRQYADYELTDIYFQRLERSIRRDPSLYLWSHNRWKRTHEEFNLRYNAITGKVDLRSLDEIMADKKKEQEL